MHKYTFIITHQGDVYPIDNTKEDYKESVDCDTKKIIKGVDLTLGEVEELYAVLYSRNNFKENDITLALTKRFNELNTEDCMECGGKARIDCQFH